MLKIVLLVAFAITIAQGLNEDAKRYNRHSELLKPETNAIDHGPASHKSAHLLGHRGEHWQTSHGSKNKKMRKNKKKTKHSKNGAHHDSLDDIRLQDLAYETPKKSQQHKKTIKKDHKDMGHTEAYRAKLQRWKAKLKAKKAAKKVKKVSHRYNKKAQHNMP